MVVKTRVASITEGKHLIHMKLKEKIHKNPCTEDTVKAVVFIWAIGASFLGEVSVAQSVEAPYFATLGDVAASVRVRIPRQSLYSVLKKLP